MLYGLRTRDHGLRTQHPRLRIWLATALFLYAALASAQPSGQADPFQSRFRTKANFQIRFRVPEKGGEVRLSTKNTVHYERDVSWEGSGDVLIEYQDVKITADRARYDFPTKTATLEGHVVIDQGPTRLAGERAVFHLESKTGTLEKAAADLAPTYHVIADTIDKIGEATYRIHHGIFTSCDVPDPSWSFSLSEATVTLDDYARMKNVAFRAGPVPLLYTPYLVWPTKENRATGLLVPGLGFSGRRGAYLGLTHYWVTGPSTDLTTQVDVYSRGAVGLGEEFRWAPAAESAGLFQGYFVRDPDATTCVDGPAGGGGAIPCSQPDGRSGVFALRLRNRWKLRLDHVSENLPWGMRGVVAIRDYSDQEFLQDFERSFALSSARQILSRAFLTRNIGADSINLRVKRSETFFGATVLQERIPSLEYFRRTSPVGRTPFYLALVSSLSYLFVNRGPNLPHGGYGRADFHPVVSLPWKGLPWLSLTATAGARWTGYTDSTDPQQQRFVGSARSRRYAEARLSLVGPSFSRLYETRIGPFAKFKHVIEPRVDYQYVSTVADPAGIPVFDEVDTPLGQNQVRYALVNRLLAKPDGPQAGSASEIASLELSQAYAFRPPQTALAAGPGAGPLLPKAGPLQAALRFTPGGSVLFDGRLDYDTRAARVTSTTVAASYSWKQNFLSATWFSSRPVVAVPLPPGSPSPNADQVRFAGGVAISRAFRLDTQLNYDAGSRTLLEDRSLLTYTGSCYTVFLEVRQLRLPPSPRRDYRLVVNLKDIGTLFDVGGSLDRLFGR